VLQYTGLAVFKKDKLVGWLNESESKGYNFIQDNVKSTVVHLGCPGGGTLVLEVIRSQTKVKGKVEKGNPKIEVHTRIEANVGEVTCQIDLTKMDTLGEIEKISANNVRSLMEQATSKVQKQYKVDVFGFGEVIHRADAAAWKSLRKDWDRHFTKLPITYQVEVKIRRLGTVGNSFLNEMNKR